MGVMVDECQIFDQGEKIGSYRLVVRPQGAHAVEKRGVAKGVIDMQ